MLIPAVIGPAGAGDRGVRHQRREGHAGAELVVSRCIGDIPGHREPDAALRPPLEHPEHDVGHGQEGKEEGGGS